MIVITLESETLDYLRFIFEEHCGKGLPLEELQIAARTWICMKDAKEITQEGVRRVFSEEEFTPLPPPQQEQEVRHIQGPVSVKVNGDMTLPVTADQVEDLMRIP